MKRSYAKYLALGLLISAIGTGAATSYAATTNEETHKVSVKTSESHGNKFVMKKGETGAFLVKADFSSFVSEGIIDQATADKMSTFIEEHMTEHQAEMETIKNMTDDERKVYMESHKKEKSDILTEMISDGILTQEQANKIKATMPSGGHMSHDKIFIQKSMNFDYLVENNIVNQSTADKMSDFMKDHMTKHQSEMEAVKNMTDAERKAFMETHKKEQIDILAEMVSNGILTQDQADKIKTTMPTGDHMDGRHINFDSLIENNIVDQSTADKMSNFMKEHMAERQSEMEALKDMTDDERDAFMETHKKEKIDILSEMLEAGIITTEQKTVIESSFLDPMKKNIKIKS